MEQIQVTARFAIHPGEFDEFAARAETCLELTREHDTGTLQYDWFYNQDHDECVVRETYKDSDALLEHISHVGDSLGPLLEVSDIDLEIYGSPTPELLEAAAGLGPKLYHFHAGL